MNYATFAGRLGKDAELRTTPGGKEVANFSIAVTIRGTGGKDTLWVDCALWGARANALAQYLTKGSNVCVAGDVGIRTYESKGTTKAVMTCNVQAVTLMGGSEKSAEKAPEKAKDDPLADDPSDDIPFN